MSTTDPAMAELARARAELKAALLKGVKGVHADERAQHLIDEHQAALKWVHAHRLAEQIREDAQARHDRDFSDNRIFRLTGAQRAADLIDPEVQR